MISFLPADHFQPISIEPPASLESLREYFCKLFRKTEGRITYSGRSAIAAILQSLGLNRQDEVWIVTTFDLPNVSSHVTSTIFNICKPSRVLTEQTKAIFVIHEFGVLHQGLKSLRQIASGRNIPLIEDCAHTMDSCKEGVYAGQMGDFTILSFPKLFPVTLGGMLLGGDVRVVLTAFETSKLQVIPSRILGQSARWKGQADRKRDIFRQLSLAARKCGLQPLFEINPDITPFFFPLKTSKTEDIVEVAASRKIDCRPWYGSDVVILPCHQFLTDSHIEEIIALIEATK